MSEASLGEAGPKIGRDVRVDRVGLVDELYDLWAKPIAAKVKEEMEAGGLEIVAGDSHQGALSPVTSTSIDARKFYRLLKAGKIKEADFLNAIAVNRTAAKKLMTEAELGKMTDAEAGTPRLSIVRRKGITLTLQQVIDRIAGVTRAIN